MERQRKRILVIGGSYFLGRVFVMTCAGKAGPSRGGALPEVHVINRGTRPLAVPGVHTHIADRHDGVALGALREQLYETDGAHFDAIVDFCAYSAGEADAICDAFAGMFDQYVLVSTVDVCAHRTGAVQDEDAPYETKEIEGETGVYIQGKIALEKELRARAERDGFHYTIARPGMIYGPFNYAPRERLYAQWIASGEPLYEPVDAAARFQLVYVKDAADMLCAICCEKDSRDAVCHICAPEEIDYQTFFGLLRGMDLPGTAIVKRPASGIGREHLPFPVAAEETERYAGDAVVARTGIGYTPFAEGMEKTIRFFYGHYRERLSRP